MSDARCGCPRPTVTDEDAVGAYLGDRGQVFVPFSIAALYARRRNLLPATAHHEMTERLVTARVNREETADDGMRCRYKSRSENIDMTVWVRRDGPLLIVVRATINNVGRS